jgi:hypothetical protein
MTGKKLSECFKTPALDKHDIEAIKALEKGTATEHQQKLALAVIIKKFARTHDQPFVPDSRDETAFLSGRCFVGNKIIKIISQPIGKIKHSTEEN